MRKITKLLSFLSLSLAFGLVIDASVNNVPSEEAVVHVDNIAYDTPKEKALDNPDGYRELGVEKEAVTSTEFVTIHYHNDDGLNVKRRYYVWITGVNGVEVVPDEISADGQDMVLTLDFKADWPAFLNQPELKFIIKFANTWSGQSEDLTIDYSVHRPDSEGRVEVWCVPGEGAGVDIFATEAETKFDKVETAKFLTYKTIECVATAKPERYELYAFDTTYIRQNPTLQAKDKPNRLFKSGVPNGHYREDGKYVFYINFNYLAKINVRYVIETVFESNPGKIQVRTATFENFYLTERFNALYNYEGNDLGINYSKEQTTFKLWAPTAGNVELNVYSVGTPASLGGDDSCIFYSMYFTKGGIWEVTVKGDLNGKYVTYTVDNTLGSSEVIDPYAKACGINGLRALVCDFETTNPENWDSVPEVWDQQEGYDITSPKQLSVYEIHIRDLTMDETWTGESPRGTYKAFAEAGTTYTDTVSGKTVTTGFDHIKELGVSAIQIIPIFDNDNNEAEMTFNWGYNPTNYNCLEGGYSTNPHDGYARIREFKELVYNYATNGNHTRVIMDVVYNHVSSAANSNFTKIMPKYYFRYDKDWNYMAGSGCANEVRTEAPMMSKFIVDSVLWWASEYKIKGFRFDLMGLIDTETMRKVKDALYEYDPDIVTWGEGWGGYAGYGGINNNFTQTHGTFTWNVLNELYPTEESKGHLAAFNDAGRNTVRGGNDQGFGTNNPYPGWGFIAQGSNDVGTKASSVGAMMRGTFTWNQDLTSLDGANPDQLVSYVSCHDNYTLFDQLNYTLADYSALGGNTSCPPASSEPNIMDVANAVVAAQSTTMFANSIAFMQGGEEILRTKSQPLELYDDKSHDSQSTVRPYPDYPSYIDPNNEEELAKYPEGQVVSTGDVWMFGKIISHNSYNSLDITNSFKWDRKISVTQNGNRYDTSDVTNKFKQMIAEHKNVAKFGVNENTNTSNISVWNASSGSTLLAMAIGEYRIFFAGREGGSASFQGGNLAQLVFSSTLNGSSTAKVTSTSITVPKYTFLVYKV